MDNEKSVPVQPNTPGDTPPARAAFKTLLVFLIPLAAFLAVAMALKTFLPPIPFGVYDLQPLITFAAAVLATLAALHITKIIVIRRFRKDK